MDEQVTIPTHFLVFDVESVGLYGDGFAVGYVLIETASGAEEATGLAWCDPDTVAQGAPQDREWVKENIPPMHESCREPGVRSVREYFWRAWRDCPPGTVLAADVAWPVEARFLLACVADDPSERAWKGPYPLIDIASVRLAKGFDPLATEPRKMSEMPAHDPLSDARQSARLLLEALALEPNSVRSSSPHTETPE